MHESKNVISLYIPEFDADLTQLNFGHNTFVIYAIPCLRLPYMHAFQVMHVNETIATMH